MNLFLSVWETVKDVLFRDLKDEPKIRRDKTIMQCGSNWKKIINTDNSFLCVAYGTGTL